MKVLILLLLISSMNAFFKDTKPNELSETLTEFKQWSKENNRQYSSRGDFMLRLSIYNENKKEVIRHNQSNSTYKKKLNIFADLTDDEFMIKYTNANKMNTKKHFLSKIVDFIKKLFGKQENQSDKKVKLDEGFELFENQKGSGLKIKDEVDWVKEGVMTDIKDQKNCGGCYSFACVSVIEANYFMKTKTKKEFSEQNLIDCGPLSGLKTLNGCSGGSLTSGMTYYKMTGVIESSQYPFIATDSLCRKNGVFEKVIDSLILVGRKTSDLLKALEISPVAVSVEVFPEWKLYDHGVFQTSYPVGFVSNHAVTLVGYNTKTDRPYMIVRNSWSKKWGINGYMRMKLNRMEDAGYAGIGSSAIYPVLFDKPQITFT